MQKYRERRAQKEDSARTQREETPRNAGIANKYQKLEDTRKSVPYSPPDPSERPRPH